MAFIQWRDSYSVGSEKIDEQHQKLVNIINQLHEAMKLGGKPALINKAVADLVRYTVEHFEYEEKMMTQARYPALAEHKRKHAGLVQQVLAYQAKLKDGDLRLTLQFQEFLKNWLLKHILETDMLYAPYLPASDNLMGAGDRSSAG